MLPQDPEASLQDIAACLDAACANARSVTQHGHNHEGTLATTEGAGARKGSRGSRLEGAEFFSAKPYPTVTRGHREHDRDAHMTNVSRSRPKCHS